MRATEPIHAVYAKGVVPDHPASTMETLFLRFDFKLGSILVSDCQPERAVGFQYTMNALDPMATPPQVIFGLLCIVIDVVLVANIKWRIRKNEID